MKLTVERLENLICSEYSITPDQLKGPCRKREYVFPRQVFCYILKEFAPEYTLAYIGTFLGNRDHTTIIHSITAINDFIDTNPKVTQRIMQFRFKIIQILKGSQECYPIAS
jgi:chromosomal replication initiator protein